jgi:transcriptional antiterminator
MDKWLTEVNEVMEEALDLVSSGGLKHVSMYKLAPRLYVSRYKVRSDLMLKKILDEVDEQIKTEWYS